VKTEAHNDSSTSFAERI